MTSFIRDLAAFPRCRAAFAFRARQALILATFGVTPLCSACGFYYSYGESRLPYQGRALHRAREIQLGVTRPQFARWSVGISNAASYGTLDSSTFFDPNCFLTVAEARAHKAAGCHPRVFSNSIGVDVQHRWLATRSLHPVMSMSVGRITNRYNYQTLEPSVPIDSAQSSPFITVRGGAEYSILAWLHLTVLGGYQEGFRQTTIRRTASNSGVALTSMLTLGRHYQR